MLITLNALENCGLDQKYISELETSGEVMAPMEVNNYNEDLSKGGAEMSDDDKESVGS
jgi:hypothetical protein